MLDALAGILYKSHRHLVSLRLPFHFAINLKSSFMNTYQRKALKLARLICFRFRFPLRRNALISKSEMECRNDEPELEAPLEGLLQSDKPFMIARFGSVEMDSLALYYITHYGNYGLLDFILRRCPIKEDWASSEHPVLCNNAGFFPKGDLKLVERFCELMLDCITELDVLGSWLKYEELFSHLHQGALVPFLKLEPYNCQTRPWSRHLAGKKVLVVHPFVNSITQQYQQKRTLLFDDPEILPEFDLQVIPAVQSIAGNHPEGFDTWFDALDHMKAQIDACDYDICLIGCGAYGFPLAAHVKRQGKQGFHMGGSLQLLFGIKGKRWVRGYNGYDRLFNEHWIFPLDSDKPKGIEKVEGGCYW